MYRPYQITTSELKIPKRDHEVTGELLEGRLSERAKFGEIFHAVTSGVFAGEKFAKATNSDSLAMPNTVMALEDKAINQECLFLVRGWVRNDAWDWTVNDDLYMDNSTSGALTSTQPGTAQFLGKARKSNLIWFEPRIAPTEGDPKEGSFDSTDLVGGILRITHTFVVTGTSTFVDGIIYNASGKKMDVDYYPTSGSTDTSIDIDIGPYTGELADDDWYYKITR